MIIEYILEIGIMLFIIGLLGLIFNRKNIILMLISIEVILLGLSTIVTVSSCLLDDMMGQNLGLSILAIAGGESAIGLAILVGFYRKRGTIRIFS